MEIGERFEEIWTKVNDGEMLNEGDVEALRVDESDTVNAMLLKNVILNRYLLLQQQSVLMSLLEGQRLQTEELEKLAEESEELTLNDRLHLLEQQAGLERMDAAVAERMREVFLGTGGPATEIEEEKEE